MMNDQKFVEHVAAIRLRARALRPYYRKAIFRAAIVRADGLGTFASDKFWRIYIDPAMFAEAGGEWTIEEATGVFLHEIEHIVRDHSERCESIAGESRRWNKSGDAEINDSLLSEGVVLPPKGITPQSLGLEPELSAEQYYALLEEQDEKNPPPPPSGGSGEGEPGEDEGEPGEGSGSGEGEGTPKPEDGDCGSAAGGPPRAWEQPAPTVENGLDGVTKAEGEAVRREVAKDVEQMATQGRGNVPANLRRWAKEKLAPKFDPRKALAAAIRANISDVSGMIFQSYRRPSRRQSGDLIMPGLRKPEPEIGVLVDTSGSMGDRDLGLAWGLVAKTIRALGLQRGIRFYAGDTCIGIAKRITSESGVEMVGGGGTDMSQAIADIERLTRRKPLDILIVVTDTETGWPTKAPKTMKVIVAATRKPSYPIPSWARTIEIHPGAASS